MKCIKTLFSKLFKNKKKKPTFECYHEFFIEDAVAIIGLRRLGDFVFNTAYLGFNKTKYIRLQFNLDKLDYLTPYGVSYNSSEGILECLAGYEKAHGIAPDKMFWIGVDLAHYETLGDDVDLFRYSIDILDQLKKDINEIALNKKAITT